MGMYEQHYLRHWGIKGMKWGVRRYQNKDGSLTDLGKKRMYREMYDTESKDPKERKKYTAEPNRWNKEDIEREKQLADSTRQLTSNLKTATDASIRNAKNNRSQMDLSNMTDKEMRDAINRAMLERQYNEMFAPQQSTKGRETVSRVLETAGNALAITGSALGVALSIKALLGK
jgi:hypothetical protein